jgi:hypothetical protein
VRIRYGTVAQPFRNRLPPSSYGTQPRPKRFSFRSRASPHTPRVATILGRCLEVAAHFFMTCVSRGLKHGARSYPKQASASRECPLIANRHSRIDLCQAERPPRGGFDNLALRSETHQSESGPVIRAYAYVAAQWAPADAIRSRYHSKGSRKFVVPLSRRSVALI